MSTVNIHNVVEKTKTKIRIVNNTMHSKNIRPTCLDENGYRQITLLLLLCLEQIQHRSVRYLNPDRNVSSCCVLSGTNSDLNDFICVKV